MRKASLDKQYEAYLDDYYEALSKYSVDFLRPLTKGEYKNARESYIADKVSEGKKVYSSNINRDLVNRSKDYAMTPAQARGYKKELEKELGIKIKYKTLRENKAIQTKINQDIKDYYKNKIEQYKKEGKEVPTKDIALEVGRDFYGSP